MKKKEQEIDSKEKEKPTPSDDLYTTPDHLKVPLIFKFPSYTDNLQAESKVANSDTTNWLTGIVEVQLPME